MGDRVARWLTLRGATSAQIRTAEFLGEPYLVVPVVALVEGVIHPSNAAEPELVLASEFSIAPSGWDGEPVLTNHPVINDEAVSANSPRVLEQMAFGRIFHTRVEGNRLLMEAWLDPRRAEAIGADAQNVIDRARAGRPIEISVGCSVLSERTSGVYNGQEYAKIWRYIVPDHLALLPEGTRGACSNEMGCGVRAASARTHVHLISGDRITPVADTIPETTMDPTETPVEKRSLRERLSSLFTFRSNASEEDLSDVDVRNASDRLLRASEPGYLGIDSVFPADGSVVYAVAPNETWQMFRREYSVAKDGSVTLGESREEVRPVTRYEPVQAQAEQVSASATTPCGCQPASSTTTVATATEGAHAMDKTQRIQALITNPNSPFDAADQAMLEACSDERLAHFESTFAQPAATTTAQPAQAAAAQPAAAAPVNWDALLASAPDHVRAQFARAQANEVAERATLIRSLTAKQTVFTEAQLTAKPTDELIQLAMLAGVNAAPSQPTDYSGRGFFAALTGQTGAAETADDAPDVNAIIKAARGVQ